MSNWWIRVPLSNVQFAEELTVDGMRIRPLMDWRESEKRIRKAQHTANPYVHTADVIFKAGEAEGYPDDPWPLFRGSKFELLRDVLEFLFQRDVDTGEAYLHREDDCSDDGIGPYCRFTANAVPYAPRIQVVDMERWLHGATTAWADECLDETTAFLSAIELQRMADIPALREETKFVQQWIAFECLFSRWSHVDRNAPQETKISRGVIKRNVRPAIKKALQTVVAEGHITEQDAATLAKSVKYRTRPRAEKVAAAFIEHIGIADVDARWIRFGCELRNKIAHGDSWRAMYKAEEDPHSDISLRRRQTRMLVNRAIMSFVGYEPAHWVFERRSARARGPRVQCSPGIYHRADDTSTYGVCIR